MPETSSNPSRNTMPKRAGVGAKMFTGKYEHRQIQGGVGHNLPQEAPKAFVQAVLDVAGS